MLKKQFFNIMLVVGILSIFTLSVGLFSMENRQLSQKTSSKDQINTILANLNQEQDALINDVLNSYRVIGFTKVNKDGNEDRSPYFVVYNDQEKENSFDQLRQNLDNKIQENENNITNMLLNSSLNNNEKEEVQQKIESIKATQEKINRNLRWIKNNENARELISQADWVDHRKNIANKTFRINQCYHNYTDADSCNITITDMSICPICEWEKNPQGESPMKKARRNDNSSLGDPYYPNWPNNYLLRQLWPIAGKAIYASCIILGIVLASKLFNWR